jgi:hypothetical protein
MAKLKGEQLELAADAVKIEQRHRFPYQVGDRVIVASWYTQPVGTITAFICGMPQIQLDLGVSTFVYWPHELLAASTDDLLPNKAPLDEPLSNVVREQPPSTEDSDLLPNNVTQWLI